MTNLNTEQLKNEFYQVVAQAYIERYEKRYSGNPIIIFDTEYQDFSAESGIVPLEEGLEIQVFEIKTNEPNCFEDCFTNNHNLNISQVVDALICYPEIWQQAIETIEA